MSSLELPVGENLLITAYQAVREERDIASAELVSSYLQHFSSPISVPAEKCVVFERFSLVDPNAWPFIQATTVTR